MIVRPGLYACTLQVAYPAALRRVIRQEGALRHVCPDDPARTVREYGMADVTLRSRRCGCPNRNCWVWVYTTTGPVSEEHGAA